MQYEAFLLHPLNSIKKSGIALPNDLSLIQLLEACVISDSFADVQLEMIPLPGASTMGAGPFVNELNT